MTVTASDSSALISNPQTISLSHNDNEIGPIHGQVAITLTFTLSKDAVPGQYEALVTATEELIGQGIYVTLVAVD